MGIRLGGKIVIVTGGLSGIEGATVIVEDRSAAESAPGSDEIP
jgi:hypothetical protein